MIRYRTTSSQPRHRGPVLAKHIDIRKHFAHEVMQERAMKLIKVATGDQLADMFTKPLPYPQFLANIEGILRTKKNIPARS